MLGFKTGGVYDVVSRPVRDTTKEGKRGQSLAASDGNVQEKLGLTAGRGNSLAAHLLGVVICFD